MNLNRIFELAFWCVILLLSSSSCEYNTDKIYYRDVNQNVSMPDLTININLNSDTIYVYNNPNVKLTLTLTNKILYDVKFFVNNSAVEQVYQTNNDFSFFINISQSQEMILRAEIYTSTGTGSIADVLHAESFLFKTKEWVLIYLPDKLELNSQVIDGRLKLFWTPIKSSSVCKYYINSSGIFDSTFNNWYIDSSYFGGQNYVSVTYNDNGISGYGIYSEIYYPFPKTYLTNRDSFLLSWEKCRFYNNIKGYQINIDTTVKQLNPSDTIYTYKNGYFGYPTYAGISLIINRKQDNSSIYPFSDIMGYYPASFLETYSQYSDSYFPATGSDFYYWIYDNNVKKIKKFSLESKSVTNSIVLENEYFAVSPNDKYILCDVGNNLKLINTSGLNTIRNIPISHILSSTSHLNMNFIISDIGTSVFLDPMSLHFKIYDLLNDSLIDSIPVPSNMYLYQYKLSANGRFLFDPAINVLYKIENNTHSTVWGNEGNSYQFKYFDFSPNDQNQIVLYDGAVFYIKNCADFSTITSFQLNHNTVLSIDFKAEKILAHNNSTFYVYSLSDGTLLNTIPTYTPSDNSHLFNDYIISGNIQLNLKTL